MKKLFCVFFLMLLVPSLSVAVEWVPTRLQLVTSEVITYDFDGSTLEIPVTVTGTPARVWFFVFTKGKGDEIGEIQNGHMGWHYVNGIDTCMYMSASIDFGLGSNTITWNGQDADGGTVPEDDYTYYLWAYDHTSPPEANIALPKAGSWQGYANSILIKELDEDGTPLANPYIINTIRGSNILYKWIVGNDPTDLGLVETTDTQSPPDARFHAPPSSPKFDDHSLIYFLDADKENLILSLRRLTWVPNDLADRDTEWGYDSGECFWTIPGPVDDGNYIYYGKSDAYTSTVPCTNTYIVDYEGEIVANFQNDLWLKPEDQEKGGFITGGPMWHMTVDGGHIIAQTGNMTLQSQADPLRYLENLDYTTFTTCFNQNGDYVMDKAWADDSPHPWVNFIEEPVWTGSCYPDKNNFAAMSLEGAGPVSFGLVAPDFTGVGHLSFSGEEGGLRRHTGFIGRDTAYDGMYTILRIEGQAGYVGQDSIKGTITSKVAVADVAPSAFAVEQNSPNPANPTTAISFTLPKSGNVTVDVFNMAGQKVDTIVNDFMDSGRHSVVWDGSNFSTGVYFYTVTSGEFSRTMKMTLLK